MLIYFELGPTKVVTYITYNIYNLWIYIGMFSWYHIATKTNHTLNRSFPINLLYHHSLFNRTAQIFDSDNHINRMTCPPKRTRGYCVYIIHSLLFQISYWFQCGMLISQYQEVMYSANKYVFGSFVIVIINALRPSPCTKQITPSTPRY